MRHLILFFLLILLTFPGVVSALNTAQIESLRRQTENSTTPLTEADREVIARFWASGLDQMLLAETSQDVVTLRGQLVAQKGSEPLSNYSAAYIAEGFQDIQAALQNVQRMDHSGRPEMVKRNLLILTAALESPKLIPIAVSHVADTDEVVRYWAVKAATQPAITEQLSKEVAGDEQAVVQTILEALSERIVAEKRPEILEMIPAFCAAFNTPLAHETLLKLADARIAACRAWEPVEPDLDIRLLTACGTLASTQQSSDVKKTFGRAFAELYAAAVQQYLLGAKRMSDESLEKTITVIAEIDQSLLSQTLQIRTGILPALKTGNINALGNEYEILFGGRTRQGELAMRFQFDYGKDAAGKPLTSPPDLKPMPEQTETAE